MTSSEEETISVKCMQVIKKYQKVPKDVPKSSNEIHYLMNIINNTITTDTRELPSQGNIQSTGTGTDK